jgi:hypothetical protein
LKIAEAIFKIKELRIMRAKKSNLKEKLAGEIREIPVKKKNYRLIEILYSFIKVFRLVPKEGDTHIRLQMCWIWMSPKERISAISPGKLKNTIEV